MSSPPLEFNAPAPAQLPPKKNPLAIWSLILGLLSLPLIFVCLGFLTAPLAIIFGIVALIQIKGGPKHISGKGLAITGLLSGILALTIYGKFISNLSAEKENESQESKALYRAGALIMTQQNGIANGNNEEAQLLAEKFSESMKTLQKELFVREGEEALLKLSGGNFITYCNITDTGIAFLVHVPEYRRYEDEAKESMSKLAWAVGNMTIADNRDLASQNPQIAIGLKGALLYGDIMRGQYGQNSSTQNDLKEADLEPFFIKDIKVIEVGFPSSTPEE